MEKEGIKIVEMNQDMHDSNEIPAYTEIPLTNEQIKKISLEKNAATRVMKLFIGHMLDTELVKVHDTLEKHFAMKDITFRTIMIRGIIVGVQFLQFKTKERTLISVDDGTGVIDCYVEKNEVIENLKSDVDIELQNMVQMSKAMQLDDLLQATLMMLQSSKKRLNKMPQYKDFQIGNTVVIVGTLSEYCGKRSCFVKSVLKDDSTNNANYIEQMHDLYETEYYWDINLYHRKL